MIRKNYELMCQNPGDIYEHLPTLYDYAKQCISILECGVRSMVSTWAFAQGLIENGSETKILHCCDVATHPNIKQNESVLKSEISFEFKLGNDLTVPIKDEYDLIFIDTWHCYGQLIRELERFKDHAQKWIIMHDTTVDEFVGESIRNHFNIPYEVITSGFNEWEIRTGLWPAIEKFLSKHPEWIIEKRYTNNNGLTILRKVI